MMERVSGGRKGKREEKEVKAQKEGRYTQKGTLYTLQPRSNNNQTLFQNELDLKGGPY